MQIARRSSWLVVGTSLGAGSFIASCSGILGLPEETNGGAVAPDAAVDDADAPIHTPDSSNDSPDTKNEDADAREAEPAPTCPGPACADFYVDHAGGANVFLTIREALVAANLSTAPARTIHVARGTTTIEEVLRVTMAD